MYSLHLDRHTELENRHKAAMVLDDQLIFGIDSSLHFSGSDALVYIL